MICRDALSVRQSQAFYATGEVCQNLGQGALTFIKDGKVLEMRQVLERVENAAKIVNDTSPERAVSLAIVSFVSCAAWSV